MKKGVILCCHGTRSIKGTYDTKKLLNFFKQKNKNIITKIAYLEIRKPSIEDQLNFFFKKKVKSLLIIPVMMFPGNHVTKDIPKILTSTKKSYKCLPKILITKPLIYSKIFFSTVQKKIEKKITTIKKQERNGIITIASNTINLKAKSSIKLLTKKITKKNKFDYHKNILITLDKIKLQKELKTIYRKCDKYLLVPLFLFRGKLLENLLDVTKKMNKECNNKFILCSHIKDHKEIYNLIKSTVNLNYIKIM